MKNSMHGLKGLKGGYLTRMQHLQNGTQEGDLDTSTWQLNPCMESTSPGVSSVSLKDCPGNSIPVSISPQVNSDCLGRAMSAQESSSDYWEYMGTGLWQYRGHRSPWGLDLTKLETTLPNPLIGYLCYFKEWSIPQAKDLPIETSQDIKSVGILPTVSCGPKDYLAQYFEAPTPSTLQY